MKGKRIKESFNGLCRMKINHSERGAKQGNGDVDQVLW